MSLDTVKPKAILIECYDRLSQILIDLMEFESDPGDRRQALVPHVLHSPIDGPNRGQ